jgi:alkanesulfonate monooxygenase SsuD/methylene tetrahydromethanopterin reductase-like flavin-dependent oxidoreductase (luciferase family)
MDVGMTLPTMLPHGRAEVLEWCRVIDEGAWSCLAVPERITYTSHSLTVQLAAAAALTDAVPIWTTIVILPAHPAVQVAKDLASVDRLSNGRLTVGLGVGGREHDYRAVEARFDHRWQRLDEQVATMRRVWAGEPPFEGADAVGPPPLQSGGPPLVAGAGGPKALARAARWAIGVDHGTSILGLRGGREDPASAFLGFDRESLAGHIEAAAAAWRDAGRIERPNFSASVWFALGPGAQEQLQRYTYDYLRIMDEGFARMAAAAATCWSDDALRDTVAAMEDAGCDQAVLVSTGTDVDQVRRAADVLGLGKRPR